VNFSNQKKPPKSNDSGGL